MERLIKGGTAGRHFSVNQHVSINDERAIIKLRWEWQPSKYVPDGPDQHLFEPLKERKVKIEFQTVVEECPHRYKGRFVVVNGEQIPEDAFSDAFSDSKEKIMGNVNEKTKMYSEDKAGEILDRFASADWEEYIYNWYAWEMSDA